MLKSVIREGGKTKVSYSTDLFVFVVHQSLAGNGSKVGALLH